MGRKDLRRALVLTAVFFLLGFIGILRHEMWRDEMQAWLAAKDSASLGQLWNVVLHQKHPVLWYAALRGLSRLWPNPAAMQLFHLAVATLSAFFLFAFAPFKTAHKIFLGFGYYFLFEYGLISRNYALGILFLFAFLVLRPRFSKSPFPAAACLFFLANTSLYGLIMAGAMVGVLGVEILSSRELRKRAKLWFGLLVVGAGLAFCVYQLKPVPTSVYESATPLHTTFNSGLLVDVLLLVPRAFLPFPRPILHFWNHPLLDEIPEAGAVGVVLGLSLLAGTVALLRRSRPAILFFALSAGGILLWSYVFYVGFARHYGHLFVAFVAALWLARSPRDTRDTMPSGTPSRLPASSFLKAGLSAVLFVHFAAGLFSYGMDFLYAFSQGKNAARIIRRKGYDRLPIAAHMSMPSVPLSGYLSKPLYYVSKMEQGTYISTNPHKILIVTAEDVMGAADLLSRRAGSDCLIVLSLGLFGRAGLADKRLLRLGKTPPAIVEGESYFLYLLKYLPPSPP